jgi:hypothetical protein
VSNPLMYFRFEGGMGVGIIRHRDRGAALRAVRKRYGTVNGPVNIRLADLPELQSHLKSGCVFFEPDFSVVTMDQAYHRADLPLPIRAALPAGQQS